MKRSSYHWLSLAIILLVFLSACTPQRRTKRYAYLLEKEKKEAKASTSNKSPTKSKSDKMGNNKSNTTKPPKTQNTTGSHEAQMVKVINVAKSFKGTPYKYGGNSRSGVDCSGLVVQSYKSINQQLPRTSRELQHIGKNVPKSNIRKGDLVFFSSNNSGSINHVGIVTKRSGSSVVFIHATSSKGVREDQLNQGYWSSRYIKSRRP